MLVANYAGCTHIFEFINHTHMRCGKIVVKWGYTLGLFLHRVRGVRVLMLLWGIESLLNLADFLTKIVLGPASWAAFDTIYGYANTSQILAARKLL